MKFLFKLLKLVCCLDFQYKIYIDGKIPKKCYDKIKNSSLKKKRESIYEILS